MSFGDDYLYAFIWQGHSMFIPLTEDAVRVSSWNELLASQWSLYFTWGGRVVGQTLTQLFAWWGKNWFNTLNAFAGILLVAEIYWCSNKGKVSLRFEPAMVCWIFFALWAFAPGFSDVFFWLTGSCIYLWPAVFLLGFLIPYIKRYYALEEKSDKSCFSILGMFFWGVVAGCGNENSICWVILALFMFLFLYRKNCGKDTWMFAGLAGLIIGYAILLLAPGNMARLTGEHGTGWFSLDLLKHHFYILLFVLLFQILMWHFSMRSVFSLRKTVLQGLNVQQDFLLVKVLLIMAFGMSAAMLFSPEFPTRSGFPGTLPLLIATGILLRLQKECGFGFVQKGAKTILISMGIVYFLLTASISIFNFYEKNIYMNDILSAVEQAKHASKAGIIVVKPFRRVSFTENLASGLHVPNYNLTDDENSWGNVAFARYYGIEGIKVEK